MATHTYWRLYVSSTQGSTYVNIGSLELRGSIGGADQCSGGTATASSVYASQTASLAFDGNDSTYWESGSGGPHWIKYQFASPVDVAEVRIKTGAYVSESPKNFELQYSDDNSTWTTALNVERGAGYDWTAGESRVYPVYNTANKYWRLNVSASNSASYTEIAELDLRATSGGADMCTGGSAYALTQTPGYGPDSAFDNNNSTYYETSVNDPVGWIVYILATASGVDEYVIRAQSGGGGAAPKSWTLESSPDGVTWTVEHTVTNETGWGAGEARTFTINAGGTAVRSVMILIGI